MQDKKSYYNLLPEDLKDSFIVDLFASASLQDNYRQFVKKFHHPDLENFFQQDRLGGRKCEHHFNYLKRRNKINPEQFYRNFDHAKDKLRREQLQEDMSSFIANVTPRIKTEPVNKGWLGRTPAATKKSNEQFFNAYDVVKDLSFEEVKEFCKF